MDEERLVKFKQVGAITVGKVRAGSVLDAMNVTQFGEQAMGYVKRHPRTHLLLDFHRVDYLSSAVLTELLKIDHACTEAGGTLRLCSLNKDIRKVFEITNLDKHFVIYKDLEEGVKRHQRSIDVQAQEQAWLKKKKV
ncbi:MAG: STAS domain-containing protein [Candidatus Hydrogenedentes bacterium]|nr:STAS domain-containing protein [Candidatus Hydrogenedentota bacterium]